MAPPSETLPSGRANSADDDDVKIVGERTLEERNAAGFANAIDLDLFGEDDDAAHDTIHVQGHPSSQAGTFPHDDDHLEEGEIRAGGDDDARPVAGSAPHGSAVGHAGQPTGEDEDEDDVPLSGWGRGFAARGLTNEAGGASAPAISKLPASNAQPPTPAPAVPPPQAHTTDPSTSSSSSSSSTAAAVAQSATGFSIGNKVRLTGLVSAQHYNGRAGFIAEALDFGRYSVRLTQGHTLLVKEGNLERLHDSHALDVAMEMEWAKVRGPP